MDIVNTEVISYKLEKLQEHKEKLEALDEGEGNFSYLDFSDFDELLSHVERNPNCFYIFNIENKNEFVLVHKFLKTLKKTNIIFKGICFFDFDNLKAENILLNLGISNVLKSNTTTKNFEIKVTMLFRALEKIIKEQGISLEYNTKFDDIKENSKEAKSLDDEAKSIEKNDPNREKFVQVTKKVEFNRKKLDPMKIGFGEYSIYSNSKELKRSKFKSKVKSNNEIYEYINELGNKGYLNLESGTIDIGLGAEHSNIHCMINDFFENEITIDVEGDLSVSIDEEISLFIKFLYDKCKVEIELDGAVEEIERYSTNSRYLTLRLKNNSSEKLEYFMSIYEKRQKSINEFMELAKGFA